MTHDGARPNFFVILELDHQGPWDEAAYAQALSRKRNLWAELAKEADESRPGAIEARQRLQLLDEIERVMRDPQARAAEQRTAAEVRLDDLKLRSRAIADRMEDMLAKGYLLDEEYERLWGEEAVRTDDGLRRRLQEAERRPRNTGSQDSGDAWRLDQSLERDLRAHLELLGQPDLYAVLRMADPEAGQAVPADRLLAAADALDRRARDTAGHGEADAMRSLAAIARQVLGSPGLRQRHDATMRLWALEALLDRYESSLEIAGEISPRQFEKFLREAAAAGIDIGAARDGLIARFHRRGWPIDMPSADYEAMLLAQVRCPRCSRLNDPESAHCAHCGRLLRVQCPRCSALVPVAARACQACGFPVGERDYVEHLVAQAEASLTRHDVTGADRRAIEAAGLWPVPADRSDELSDRIRAAHARIAEVRAARRELIRQVDSLMDTRSYRAAARLLREAVVPYPELRGHLEECEDAIRASDQRLDEARAPGLPDEERAALYDKALRACADNDEARSELTQLSLAPVIPWPLSAYGQPPRVSVHEVELDSPPADRGVVKIVCARLPDRSPQAGAEFPEDELRRYRTVSPGERDIWISDREWLRKYTLVLVLHGQCYIGGTRCYARGPEVTGLRAVHAGTSVRVTWTWPAGAPGGPEVSEALVAWDDSTEIGDPVNVAPAAQLNVSREPGAVSGHCEIPATGRLFVRVAVVVRHQGTTYVSSGVRVDARRVPVTLRYEVVRTGRGRRGKLVMSVDGGRLDQLPALSLRGRRDGRPATRDGGEEVARITAGLAARELPVKLEDANGGRIEPGSCRLFAVHDPGGATIHIIDPA